MSRFKEELELMYASFVAEVPLLTLQVSGLLKVDMIMREAMHSVKQL